MDRHNIPTHLPESLHCTHIKDYRLKESVFDRDRDLFLSEEVRFNVNLSNGSKETLSYDI